MIFFYKILKLFSNIVCLIAITILHKKVKKECLHCGQQLGLLLPDAATDSQHLKIFLVGKYFR